MEKARQALEDLRSQLSAEETRLEGVAVGISQSKEEQLKSALLELMNLMAQARNEIRYADQQKESLERRMSRSAEESGKWTARLEELSVSQKTLKDRISALGKEIRESAEQLYYRVSRQTNGIS